MPRRRKKKKKRPVKSASKRHVPEWKKKWAAKKQEVSDWAKKRKIDEPMSQFFGSERPFWAT